MTDEEKLAEEQVKKWDSILYSTMYPVALVKDFIRKAFLAGLEAGRPKWHDLRKNPEDLPKINQKVLLQIKDEGRPIMDFYTRYGVWNFTNEYEAIAWCEIPKFEEQFIIKQMEDMVNFFESEIQGINDSEVSE